MSLLARIAFLLAIGSTAVFAADLKPGLITLGKEKVYLEEGTLSPDGRYAAGWTIHSKPGKPAVKWQDLEREDAVPMSEFMDNEDYIPLNVVVDLKARKVAATFSFTDPYVRGKNHGSFAIAYGPEEGGRRFAVAVSGGKWEPFDLSVVELGGDDAPQVAILKTVDEAVERFLQSKKIKGGYVTDWWIIDMADRGLLTGFSDANSVRIPFNTCVPKREDVPSFTGTVELRLASGAKAPQVTVGPVTASKQEIDPYADNADLAAADKQLNAAYSALRGKLKGAAKNQLTEDQRAWIKTRDEKVEQLDSDMFQNGTLANRRHAKDRLRTELTLERAKELASR